MYYVRQTVPAGHISGLLLNMRKEDLMALAKRRGVAVRGSKRDIVQRLVFAAPPANQIDIDIAITE